MTGAVLRALRAEHFDFKMASGRTVDAAKPKVTDALALVARATVAAVIRARHLQLAGCARPAFVTVARAQHAHAAAVAISRLARNHVRAVGAAPPCIANAHAVLAVPVLRATLAARHGHGAVFTHKTGRAHAPPFEAPPVPAAHGGRVVDRVGHDSWAGHRL